MLLQGSADVKSSYNSMNKLTKVKKVKEITERELKLEPLCHDVKHSLLFTYLTYGCLDLCFERNFVILNN